MSAEKELLRPIEPHELEDKGNFGKYVWKVVGFFMILVYLYKFITIKFFVNFSPDPCKKNKKMFFHSFYIMFVFELLFKGSGYFTQTTFLFFVVLLSLLTIDSSSRWKNDAYNHEAH